MAPDRYLRRFLQPGPMTSPGEFARAFAALPGDIRGLARVAQGLVVHEHLGDLYDLRITDESRSTVHLRRLSDLLAHLDDRPLTVERPPAERLAGNCRQFAVLFVALLQAHGIPARARCGFGAYFGRGKYEDHWVTELWSEGRWRLADAQIDDVQARMLRPDFDLMDMPRDRFIVAGAAWQRARSGEDPELFGLGGTDDGGLWWIAGNLIRDVAALNDMPMLGWDVWGAMATPSESTVETIGPERIELYDRLAALTADEVSPDVHTLYAEDDRLRVPDVVLNFLRDREERVLSSP